MDFGRQWFGYKRATVDKHVADQDAAITSLRLEIERLRSAEPLLSAADEISSLLTSFAVAVSTTREQAERDAIATRRAAEEYAEALKAETARQCNEARAQAAVEADTLLNRARDEAASVQRAQERVESALGDAARGIFSLMELLEHTRAEPDAGAAAGPPSPAAAPQSPAAPASTAPPASPPPASPPPASPARPAFPATPAPAVSGHPFDEVRVDPRDGMVVHFAPPPEPQHAGPPSPPLAPSEPPGDPHAVRGEGEPDWHQPGHDGHDGAGAAGPQDRGFDPEPPPAGNS